MKRAVLVIGLVACAGACLAAGAPGAEGPTPWWSDRAAGLWGGIGGAVIGILGGLIGTLTSLGKAGALVLGIARGLVVLGLVSLIVGIVAVVQGQPYAVYYPLLLTGFIVTFVIGLNLRTIRLRYEQVEMQKMRTLDAEDGGAA